MADSPDAPLVSQLADYPLFMLKLFTYPRSLVRSFDWDDGATLRRIALYTLISLAILVAAFSDNRPLAASQHVLLSTFKGVMMRAHLRSWDWLGPVYGVFNLSQGEAMRLWDTLLTTGFLCYTFFASLIGLGVVARIRMAWRGLSWSYALGSGLLGYIALASCTALSLVPLTELLICRQCAVRLTLYILLNLAGWTYLGYYTLGDFGERPRGMLAHLTASLGYGTLQFLAAYLVFFVLIVCIIPM